MAMGPFRKFRVAAGVGLWMLALAPLPALVAAAWFDRGPGGEVRPGVFPSALALFDPWVWVGARNSLVMAVLVTATARVVGVGVARQVAGRRFWGRRPMAWLTCAGLATPPAFGALGLQYVWSRRDVSSLGPAWLWERFDVGANEWPLWLAWFWSTAAWATPLVGLAAAHSLRRVEPSWSDAALLAGASPRQTWRQFVWPTARPEVARAMGLVFTLTLLEPGAPLVLGLRRTLGHQIVQAALASDAPGQLTRAAVLALGGTLLAAFARSVIQWWGGATSESPVDPPPRRTALRPRPVPWGRVAWPLVLTGLAAALAVGPTVAVVLASSPPGRSFGELAGDALLRRYAFNALALGLAVVIVDLTLAVAARQFSGRGRGWVGRWAGLVDGVPPLAIGVGGLALPAVLTMAADFLAGARLSATGAGTTARLAASVVRRAAALVDLDTTPGVALLLAVALSRLPAVARGALIRFGEVRPSRVEAEVVSGSASARAWRRQAGGFFGVPVRAVVLAWAGAVGGVAPAIVLCPTAETRPAGAGVVVTARENPTQAATLAVILIGCHLLALGFVATRDRGGRDEVRGVN